MLNDDDDGDVRVGVGEIIFLGAATDSPRKAIWSLSLPWCGSFGGGAVPFVVSCCVVAAVFVVIIVLGVRYRCHSVRGVDGSIMTTDDGGFGSWPQQLFFTLQVCCGIISELPTG